MGTRNQKEFADWLGDLPKKVNDYLLGNNRPAWDFLSKLARKGINLNWFLTGEGPVYITKKEGDPIPPEAMILLREIMTGANKPDDLTEILKELKHVQQLKHEMFQAVTNLKESFKRKKSEK